MKGHIKIRRMIGILLAILLMVTSLPLGVLAQSLDAGSGTKAVSSADGEGFPETNSDKKVDGGDASGEATYKVSFVGLEGLAETAGVKSGKTLAQPHLTAQDLGAPAGLVLVGWQTAEGDDAYDFARVVEADLILFPVLASVEENDTENAWVLDFVTDLRRQQRQGSLELDKVAELYAQAKKEQAKAVDDPAEAKPGDPLLAQDLVDPLTAPAVDETQSPVDTVTVMYIYPQGDFERRQVSVGGTAVPLDGQAEKYGKLAFLGWYTKPGSTEAADRYNFAQSVGSNMVLYAQYRSTYLIQFANEDGMVFKTQNIQPGGAITEPSAAEIAENIVAPAGHRLIGWVQAGQHYPLNFEYETATADTIYQPLFSENYVVVFNSGGSRVDPLVVKPETAIDEPENPTRGGYSFKHWSRTPGGEAFNFAGGIRENTTLYAVWTPDEVSFTVALWLERSGIPTGERPEKGNFDDYNYITKVTGQTTAGATVSYDSFPTAVRAEIDAYLDGTRDTYLKYGKHQFTETKTIAGDGSTVINLFVERKVYNYTMTLPPEITMEIKFPDGTTGNYDSKNPYHLKAKFEEEIYDTFPVVGMPNVTFEGSNNGGTAHSWQRDKHMNRESNIASRTKYLTAAFIAENGRWSDYTLTMNTQATGTSYHYLYMVEALPEELNAQGTAPADENLKYFVHEYPGYRTGIFIEMTSESQDFPGNLGQKMVAGQEQFETTSWSGNSFLLYEKEAAEDQNLLTIYQETGKYLEPKESDKEYYRVFKYRRNAHKLSYDLQIPAGEPNDNQGFEAITLLQGQSLTSAKPDHEPQREGYTFVGWSTSAEGKRPFDFERTMTDSPMVVYALWRPDGYTVSFYESLADLEGNKAISGSEQSVAAGKNADAEAAVYQPGVAYAGKGIFEKWTYFVKTTEGLLYEVDWDWEIAVDQPYQLLAKFKKNGFTLTYDRGEGGGTAPLDTNRYGVGDQTVVAGAESLQAPAGKVFYGWLDEQTERLYTPGDFLSFHESPGDRHLVAQYAKEEQLVEVTYHSNTAEDETAVVYYEADKEISLKSEASFNNPGHSLAGWNLEPGEKSGGPDYELGEAFPAEGVEPVHLYAHWQAADFRATFTTENGAKGKLLQGDEPTETVEVKNLKAGTTFDQVPVPKTQAAEDYTFVGWQNLTDGSQGLPAKDEKIGKDYVFQAVFAEKIALKLTAKDLTGVAGDGTQTFIGSAQYGSERPYTVTGNAGGLSFYAADGKTPLDTTATGQAAGRYPGRVSFTETEKIVVKDSEGREVTGRYGLTLESGTLTLTAKAIDDDDDDKPPFFPSGGFRSTPFDPRTTYVGGGSFPVTATRHQPGQSPTSTTLTTPGGTSSGGSTGQNLGETPTPFAYLQLKQAPSWSLFNALLAVGALAAGLLTLLRTLRVYRRQRAKINNVPLFAADELGNVIEVSTDTTEDTAALNHARRGLLLGVLTALGGLLTLAAFLMLEDLSLPMTWANTNTLTIGCVFAVCLVFYGAATLGGRRTKAGTKATK